MLVNFNSIVRRRRSARGSVLVIALLLVMLGTFGMTAWFGLIGARSLEVNAMEDGMRRRVQLNSVKEVARQAGSEWFLSMDGGKASTTTISMPGTSGQIVMPAWAGTSYTNVTDLRYHYSGGAPAESNSVDVLTTLDDGGGPLGAVDYNVQLRTYVPALQGELLTIHEPEIAATPVTTDAGLLVNGKTVVWDPDNGLAHRTERLHTSGKVSALTMLDLAGSSVLPDNSAFVPRSTGNDFIGRLKQVDSSESSANRYTSRLVAAGYVAVDGAVAAGDLAVDGYSSDGAGDISIEIGSGALPNIQIVGNALTVRLIGQSNAEDFAASSGLAARMIVVTEPSGERLSGPRRPPIRRK